MNINIRSVEFNVRIGCPIRCGYCPQHKVINSGYEIKTLTLEVLSKVLTNASNNKAQLHVVFSGHSEPMSVPNWLELLEHAHSLSYVSKIVMFSTGYKLDDTAIYRLSSLNKLNVVWHIGKKDLMPGLDESFVSKIPLVKELMPSSKFVCVGLEDDFDELRQIVKSVGAELTFDKVINRAGNLEVVTRCDDVAKHVIPLGFVRKHSTAVTCRYMNEFKRPVVMPDGTTLACPNDYGSDLVIGNLYNQTWEELDFNRVVALQRSCPDVICKKGCHQAIPVPV
jgi:organic radical activating enzyme